jgi:hypothetical protein
MSDSLNYVLTFTGGVMVYASMCGFNRLYPAEISRVELVTHINLHCSWGQYGWISN